VGTDAPEVVVEHDPPAAVRDAILAVLNRATAAALAESAGALAGLAAVVKAAGTETVIGGIWARTGRNMLMIELVALPPELRGAGLGTRLLAQVEAEGIRRDCHNAWLQTGDWEARGFYEKCGYRVFGELQDNPIGHTRYFMTKRLRA
jgi:GNAT superfamily N-acetyltransferase